LSAYLGEIKQNLEVLVVARVENQFVGEFRCIFSEISLTFILILYSILARSLAVAHDILPEKMKEKNKPNEC